MTLLKGKTAHLKKDESRNIKFLQYRSDNQGRIWEHKTNNKRNEWQRPIQLIMMVVHKEPFMKYPFVPGETYFICAYTFYLITKAGIQWDHK